MPMGVVVPAKTCEACAHGLANYPRHMRRVLGMPPLAVKRLLAETAAS
jgi:hypothetical protein